MIKIALEVFLNNYYNRYLEQNNEEIEFEEFRQLINKNKIKKEFFDECDLDMFWMYKDFYYDNVFGDFE